MTKILVVDDETDLEMLIRQKFRKQIRDGQYEFVFAINGSDALDKLVSDQDISIILSDINMPRMDGLSLLTHVNEASPLVKTIMVSAYGDMNNIRNAMNKGAFDFVCKPVDFDDLSLTLQKTITHVAQLKATIQAIKENNILRMYVDESVLNFMNTRQFENTLLINESVEASVVFMDICGFTEIAENESPDKTIWLLNKYFDIMVTEIIALNGHVDKFIGDAIMAVFKGNFHLDRAIDACLAVRSKIEKLPHEETGDKFLPKLAIGVNSGELVSGNIGSFNLRRLDYTVIGDVVNIASRLQSLADPGQILITKQVYDKISKSFRCRQLGEFSLKNRIQPEIVYEVIE